MASLDVELDGDTLWREVFNTLTSAEQTCVRDALGDDLELALDRPIADEDGDVPEWEALLFSCLVPETARGIFFSILITTYEEETDAELSEEETSCLREWVAEIDVARVIAATADEDAAVLGEVLQDQASCMPDLFLAAMVEEMGVELEELSEDERSCLREWVTELDWTALAGTDDDPAGYAMLLQSLVSCVPDLILAAMVEEMGVELDELSEDEMSCLREWVTELDWAALAGDGEADGTAAFGAFFGIIACVPELWSATEDEFEGDDDHANSVEGATAATVGEDVEGTIDYLVDVDYFVFEAEQGTVYQIDVALGTLDDSAASLYDADGLLLDYNDDREDTLASRIVWEAPGSGEYYVHVEGYGTGTYTLTVSLSDVDDD